MTLCARIDEALDVLKCAREAAEIVTLLQHMYQEGHTISITLLEHGRYEVKRDRTAAIDDTLIDALRKLHRTPFGGSGV